ncbi:hypothetical protein PTKIN_Ptkin09bG0065900 [Pterospermum kingtungense]
MASQEEDNPKLQFPLHSGSYKLLDEIGYGAYAVVYRAECAPLNSTVVAIKAIDLDQYSNKAEVFANIQREIKTMSLLSHPNILSAHCSFIVDQQCLCVVMPFMSAGSLQSIISSSFPDGLPEECIAVVLKETLTALSYLHNQGHLHGDIKASNILLDSSGSVKLADSGVSASSYASKLGYGSGTSTSSSTLLVTDVMETPYWMAPEVIHSRTYTGYSFKAESDIWSFGIMALELAHGRPPLSHLPPSKSLIMETIKRFRFSGYETSSKKGQGDKYFSMAFKDMVASCLDQDPAKRPSAPELLKHSFFESCKDSDFLVEHVLQGLPSVEERFRLISNILKKDVDVEVDDEDIDVELELELAKYRRISCWNFNIDEFELDPVFPSDSKDDSIVKQVRFGGQTIIPESEGESSLISPPPGEDGSSINQGIAGNAETMVDGLLTLKSSLDDQRQKVTDLINMFGADVNVMNREDELVQMIETLKLELENEREMNFQLEKGLEFLKIQISGASRTSTDQEN